MNSIIELTGYSVAQDASGWIPDILASTRFNRKFGTAYAIELYYKSPVVNS